MSTTAIGFQSQLTTRYDKNDPEIFLYVEPGDLQKFGLIPELIGRLPVITGLHELDEKAMIDILSRPKNALVKQYTATFPHGRGVELEFEEDALKAIVKQARTRKTGARGLKSIIEKSMLDIMFQLPSSSNIERCIITRETIEEGASPIFEKRKASA